MAKFQIQKEIQFKLFLRFLKHHNLLKDAYRCKPHLVKNSCNYPWTSFYEYLWYVENYILVNKSFSELNRIKREWKNIVERYKKIKKKKYAIYGKGFC